MKPVRYAASSTVVARPRATSRRQSVHSESKLPCQFIMGKGEQIKQDLEQFAHDEKNRVMRHDDKEDVKKKLSHEDKAENFTASSGITSDGA